MMTAFERKLICHYGMIDTQENVLHRKESTGDRVRDSSIENDIKSGDDIEYKISNRYNLQQDSTKKLDSYDNEENYDGIIVENDTENDQENNKISKGKERKGWTLPPPKDQSLLSKNESENENKNEMEQQRSFQSSEKFHDNNDSETSNNNGNEVIHSGRERRSLYSDLSIPISFFLVEGMHPPEHDSILTREKEGKNIISQASLSSKTENTKTQTLGQIPVAKVKGSWETPMKDKTGKLVNQPVTFQPTLRSSGYGNQNQISEKCFDSSGRRKSSSLLIKSNSDSTMKKSSTSTTSTTGIKNISGSNSNSSSSSSSSAGPGPRLRIYPRDCNPMTLRQDKNDYPLKGTAPLSPIYDITYRY